MKRDVIHFGLEAMRIHHGERTEIIVDALACVFNAGFLGCPDVEKIIRMIFQPKCFQRMKMSAGNAGSIDPLTQLQVYADRMISDGAYPAIAAV